MPTKLSITPAQFTTFGELLRFLRHWAGLSQRELSVAVNYSEGQVSRLEKNERAPDAAVLAEADAEGGYDPQSRARVPGSIVELLAFVIRVVDPRLPLRDVLYRKNQPNVWLVFLLCAQHVH